MFSKKNKKRSTQICTEIIVVFLSSDIYET